MKVKTASILFVALFVFAALLCAGRLCAQNPAKAAARTTDDSSCGPAGCVTPSVSAGQQVRTDSPITIRSMGDQDSDQGTRLGSTSTASSTQPGQQTSLRPPPLPPEKPTAFEQFVADSLGHKLPLFGRELFNSNGAVFAPSSAAAPPADYVLGTGDEIVIRTWGKIDIDARARVDRNGQIFVPQVGTLTVAGMRLDRLTDFIRSSIAQQFKGFEITVSLGQLRSIQVFVLGQARMPGVYTISSLSTLVNALFASGGPSHEGSLRDIQVKRAGVTITHFDVYRLLLQGDKSADVHLLPGDIIYIPPVGPQVAVDGYVDTPAIFELEPSATVGDVIAEAGGLNPVAGTARAVLEHIIDHSRRSVEELALNDKGRAIKMMDGDILRIFPISSKIDDAVTLRGNVALPGRYGWHAGMRISDLIPNREFLLTREYFNRQNQPLAAAAASAFGAAAPVSDLKPDVDETVADTSDEPAAPQGVPQSSSQSVTAKTAPISKGPAADKAPPAESHDTEINWNYAAIERLDPIDLTTHIVSFALGEAIAHPDGPENKQLEAGDVVIIYSRKDVSLPLELQAKFVRIDGQVKAPGVYRVEQDETLRDLVRRAGGFVPHAYLYAAQLTRESVRVEQQIRLHDLIERESQEVLSPSNQERNASGSGGSTSDLDLRKAYIAELSNVQPSGRVVLQLKPDAMTPEDVPAFVLEDGDHFFVPTVPNTIDVLGSVYNEGALRYLSGNRAAEYLDAAGGSTRDGDRKREFIIRADGSIVSHQHSHDLERLRLYPGDAVVVPPKLKAGFSGYDFLNFTQIISAFALSAVAIKALQ